MHPTKFQFIWQNGFRGELLLEFNKSETRIVCDGHVCSSLNTEVDKRFIPFLGHLASKAM
jgi:hypothetical protein